MNNEPVAWLVQYRDRHEFRWKKPEHLYEALACEPLYTHPHPDNLELAESIIKQQQLEIEALKKENDFIKNNLCTPLLGPMFHGHTYEEGKALQTKPLTDEEIDLVREVLNGCVSSIKTEIDQELQTFKGYEHCSNLPSLESELKDAEKAMEILRKAQEK